MLIQNDNELAELCKSIKHKNILFLDTEFDRKNTYYSKLSYLSVFDGHKFWIIDALSKINLDILKEVISNKKIIKVIHGSQQDLEIFNNLQIKIEPLFDTQIAAQFCGYEQPISYSNAVDKVCKIKLNKDLQNSDWLKRPLDKKTAEYLKNDVKYLKKLYTFFYKQLKKNKNLKFFYEEMENLNNTNKILSTSAIRKKLSSQTINKNKFQQLLKIRENIASSKNLPKNWIFKDDRIHDIIKKQNFKDIKENQNLTTNEKKLIIKTFKSIKIINAKKKIFNKNIINIINIFKSEVSKKYQISEQLISNKNDIKNYIENNIKKESKWRENIFYKITDKLLTKEIKIKINKNKILFY